MPVIGVNASNTPELHWIIEHFVRQLMHIEQNDVP